MSRAIGWRSAGRLLPELILGFIGVGAQFKSLTALHMLHKRGLGIDADTARRILKQFLAQSKPETIHRAIFALLAVRGLDDNDSIQLITNSYLRSVDFVKGAVSLATLPEPDVPEVAFIGRSNVGKSSLINMITNRKGLAFTSKSPGRTSSQAGTQ
ncbi:hypothetical protein B484DRAFT_396034 [Ochromonadaceae sp. CCMP2298]|nr:hypothetical protein B484DRAFT_396034 [Ochromonadaceae sp. CCMP2298]